jgi:hypothetical protein
MGAGKLKKLPQPPLFAKSAITGIYGDQTPFAWRTTAVDVRSLRQGGTT